jgi:hypothetical protein
MPQSGGAAGTIPGTFTAKGKNMGNMRPFELKTWRWIVHAEYFTRNWARGDAFFDHFLWPQSGRAAGGAKSAPTAQGKNMGNMHPFELNHAWFKRSRTGLHPRFFQRGTTSGGFRARFSLGGRLLGTFLAGRPWGRKIASWGRVLGPRFMVIQCHHDSVKSLNSSLR